MKVYNYNKEFPWLKEAVKTVSLLLFLNCQFFLLTQTHLKKAPFVNSSQPKLKDIVSGSSRAPNVESS